MDIYYLDVDAVQGGLMKVDIYTKALLTIIAVCLVVMTFQGGSIIKTAKAGEPIHCTGDLKTKLAQASTGKYYDTEDGYNVDILCG